MVHRGVNKNRVAVVIFVVVAVLFAIFIGLTALFGSVNCENFSCFKENMKRCSVAEYVNEDTDATWTYKILGSSGRDCIVSVKLSQAKKGDLGIAELEGLEMECAYTTGTADYPEKDLTKCHGRLKEELQEIIIEKLHTVIIENLGAIDTGLNS